MANINGNEIYFGIVGDVGQQATLITKSITANGTYQASSDNADGYSSVEVNVSGGADYISSGKVLGIECENLSDINLTDSDAYLNPYKFRTIEVCFKWTAAPNQLGRIVELTASGYSIGLCMAINTNYPNSNFEVKIGSIWVYDEGTSGITIPADEIHTLTMVTDTGTSSPSEGTKIYLDGVLIKSTTIAISPSEANYDFKALQLLGAGSSNRQLTGTVYNFRAYNRLLSAAEVAQNYAVDAAKYV